MDHNIELLGYVYENAELARDTLGTLMKRCKDARLRCEMTGQFAEYHTIMGEADTMLAAAGKESFDKGDTWRCPIHISIKANLCIDHSASHIAEMLMQGYVAGMVDMERKIKRFTGAQEETIALARRLLAIKESHLQRMRQYL